MGHKVLVTGATGTVGNTLVKRLSEQYPTVRVLIRREKDKTLFKELDGIEYHIGDLSNPDSLQDLTDNISIVYHLARCPVSRPEREIWRVNVEGIRNLLDRCTNKNIKQFIFFSSLTVMGFSKNGSDVFNEETPCQPINFLAHSKLAAEALVLEYHEKYNLPYTILRLPLVYGEGARGLKIFIQYIRRKRLMTIGKGETLKSFCYLGNLVDATMLITNNKKAMNTTYIVSDAKPYSLNQVADILNREMKGELRRVCLPYWLAYLFGFACEMIKKVIPIPFAMTRENVKLMAADRVYDISKIKALGYEPKVELEEGLVRTIRWFRETGKL